MAENFVQIRIKASDTAKPDLDSLRADLDELGSKVDTAKIDVNDADAKRKLLEINAELARLNKRVASSRIDVAGAAKVESDLAKVSEKFDEMREKADKAREHATEDLDRVREHASKLHEMVSSLAGKGGLLGRLLFGAAGEAGGNGGSGALGGLKDVLPFGGNPAALAGIAGAIAAALTEIDAVASGFAAAGAGAGAFALLARPAFESVSGAYTKIQTDQKAYNDALTASAKNTALKKLQQDYKDLDPAERGALHGLQNLMDTYHKMAKAFEPQAFKVFNQGLKLANELLPHVAPFANIFASGLSSLLKQADKFAGSKGFTDWLKQFKGLEGGSLHAIGEGLGHVVTNFGKLFTIMSKKDVVNGLNIAFSILDGTLIGLRVFIKITMRAFDDFNGAMKWAGRAVDALVHVIASGFDEARANIRRWAADVGRDATRVVDYFRALPGRIMSALSSLGGRLFAAGAHIISMLANGIRSAIGDVVGAIGSVVSEITSHLPFSPAKKGPLSGRGSPDQAGKRIAQMLAQGLDEGRGAVSGAADRMAGAASLGGHGAGGGRGQIVLEFHVPTALAAQLSPQFWTAFANGVRAKGGSSGIVTRKVKFA